MKRKEIKTDKQRDPCYKREVYKFFSNVGMDTELPLMGSVAIEKRFQV